ncbi:MAG TPA: tail fiber protein, partial [Opitutaceae bacterium]|nr:tail fiber protein [Opitutaceae bacterium]
MNSSFRAARNTLLLLAAALALPAAYSQTSIAGGGVPFNVEQPYLVVPTAVATQGIFPAHSSGAGEFAMGGTLGFVYSIATNFPPNNTVFAQGQLLSIASNTALFSLMGTNYGGNGTTNYQLPNLTGRPIIGAGNGPGLTPQVVGEANGSTTHALLTIEMPTHTHSVASGGITGPSGNGFPFDKMQPTLAMTRLIAAEGLFPSGSSGAAVTIGHVATFAGNFTPYGWVPADGALYPIADYAALYAVIGTTYGGDGVNTFAVPDLRGRLSVGADSTFPLGTVFGSETTTLSTSSNAAHAHLGPGGATGITGSSVQFNNYAPSLALNYIIAVSGLYPSNGSGSGFDPDTPFLGQIAEFAGNVAPDGWLICQGQILPISTNAALFSLLGTTYGGNGSTTFALPDFRGRTMVGLGGSYPSGAQAGTGSQQINSSNLPPHVHVSPPFEPTIGTATASPGQASVAFSAPSNTGGAGITGYTVTSNPGGFTGTGGASPIVVTGLANGTPYTFTVKATNGLGAGAPSAASNSVTPFVPSAPDAPIIGLATAGNGSGSITFSAPAFDGGSPIVGYTATCSPGFATASNTVSPIVVGGLVNGTAHTCTVTATNAIGTSTASAASNAITPIGPQAITFNNPGAQNFGTSPTLTASASSGLTVTFSSSTSGVCTITAGGVLTFVTAGTCSINANQAGNAAFLAASQVSQSFAVNAIAPGAPTIGVATGGDTQATVTFAAPASNGGAVITGYTATAIPGGATGTGATSPITVTGLTNGVAYTFTVTATNSAGTGAPSAPSNSVTPKGTQTITFNNPGAQNFGTTPTLTASSTSALAVTFTSSSTGVCTTTSGGTLTFVTAGTCTINADQAGNGTFLAATQVARSFTVNAIVPGAPTIGVATAGDTQATVTFAAPASSGGAAITGYTATANPGGATGTGASSPLTVTGLTNGVTYTFTVTATNSAGSGAASAASNAVTPRGAQTITFANPGGQTFGTTPTLTATASSTLAVTFTSSTPAVCTITAAGVLTFVASGTCTINADQAGNSSFLPAPQLPRSFTVNAATPGAPTIGVATAGDTQATVTFTAPAITGGSAITGYTATASPGGATATGAGSPLTVTGLTNGTGYTFTVRATNIAGAGASSAPSNAVTPKAAQTITFANPGAQSFGTTPTLTATATSSLSVTFASTTTSVCTITAGGTLAFLTAGNCTINADQAGNASFLAAPQVARSFAVSAVVPGAPTIGTATPGTGQISVSFSAPASTGGSPITGYTVSCVPGPVTASGAASPVVVAGLSNGVAYNCTVVASNSAGSSPPSGAASATPLGQSFTGPTGSGSGMATVSFTGGGATCSFAPQGIGALQS